MLRQKLPISNKQRFANLTIVGIVSQVGCLTLVIILAALFGGLYIDNVMQTKPWFTVGLIIASIPISLVIMVFVVKTALRKLKPEIPQEEQYLGNEK